MAYDAKVDSWSLGVTLYVMLVARFPVYHRDERGRIFGVKVPHALSAPARKLVEDLLNADPEVRATAADALASPWCAGPGPRHPPRRGRSALVLTPPTAPPGAAREAGDADAGLAAAASKGLEVADHDGDLGFMGLAARRRAAAVARAAEPARGARARPRRSPSRGSRRRRRCPRGRRAARRSLDLNVRSDDDILELMLPVTADDLRAPDDGADGLGTTTSTRARRRSQSAQGREYIFWNLHKCGVC
ncbi:serine/threonine kinase [Aureococcus anophagefferens]|nr:serine/threonine kinase [Aureococcus anophagefferens]